MPIVRRRVVKELLHLHMLSALLLQFTDFGAARMLQQFGNFVSVRMLYEKVA